MDKEVQVSVSADIQYSEAECTQQLYWSWSVKLVLTLQFLTDLNYEVRIAPKSIVRIDPNKQVLTQTWIDTSLYYL